ncbi:MAG: HD domain-containing protein [Christensenellales bacterium]
MTVTEYIKGRLMAANQKYKDNSRDGFDFWEQHIRLVVEGSLVLAEEYGADREIVELGALLHDIALVSSVGKRRDHHINGGKIADKLLTKYGYPDDKKARVLGCVLHHKSSKYAENIEEICVADGDILAHFRNIPLCFVSACRRRKFNTSSVDGWVRYFQQEWDDLSVRTKQSFKPEYDTVMDVLFGWLR